MITIIICTIIGMLIGIYGMVKEAYFGLIEDLGWIIVFGIVGAVEGLLCGLFIALLLPNDTITVTDTYYLESLQDNNSVQGSFFLGIGSFSGKMKYVYYYEDNGVYKMNQISYNDAVVKYTTDRPKIELFRDEPTDATINKFSIFINCNNDPAIIYVPRGTINNNFNLDAR